MFGLLLIFMNGRKLIHMANTKRGLSFAHPDMLAFIETVRTGSVSQGARALGISQPAMSARLARFAGACGVALLERQGRGVRLTAEGAALHDGALAVLRQCESFSALTRGPVPGRAPLRVGTADAVPKVVVRRILGVARADGVRLECREWRSDELERELLEHRLDLLISDRPIAVAGSPGLVVRSAGKSRVALCARRRDAPAMRRALSSDLEGVALGLPAHPSPLRQQLDEWMARHASGARIAVETEDRALLHHFAQAEAVAVPVALATAPLVERQFGLARVGVLPGVEDRSWVAGAPARLPPRMRRFLEGRGGR